jgi:peptide/nickel transport system ATP-binding protein
MTDAALLRVEGLTKHFPVTRGLLGRQIGAVRAVDDVSFGIERGETLGLVGESGSGKTTVGRSILRLIEPSAGSVVFDGTDVLRAAPDDLRRLRRSMQVIFQDPYSSLNPRLRVIDLIGEALEVHGLTHGAETEQRVSALLRRVGLAPSALNRYPHEFSGGQRQRIGVARAIALDPKLVICDEPVSALDVSIQAQVVNLLQGLGRELGLAYLFIAHDLSVVRHLSHRVAVMYLGEIVEIAPVKALFAAPAHPYTRALLSAIPLPDPTRKRRRLVLTGDIPSPLNPPAGCRFHTRCPAVMERCKSESPVRYEPEPGHVVRCFHAEGAAGPDWFAEVDARIGARVAENESRLPPARVDFGALAAGDRSEARANRAATAEAAATRASDARDVRDALARDVRRRSRVLVPLVVFALLAFVVGALWLGRRRSAERELTALAGELTARARATGTLPETLGELGWRLPPIVGNRGLVDPWGNPYRYRVLDGGRRFELRAGERVRSSEAVAAPRVSAVPAR